MKKLLIALGLVVCVVLVGFGYLLINANSLIGQHKGDLESIATKALGSKVALGNITVSVFPSAKLLVDNFSVGEGNELTKFSNLTVRIGLLPLLSGTIALREVGLRNPSVTVIQSRDGIRIAGLPAPKKSTEVKPAPVAQGKTSGGVPQIASPIGVNLERLFLEQASVTIKNEITGKEAKIISDLNLSTGVSIGNSGVDIVGLTIDGGVAGGNLTVRADAQNVGTHSSPVKASLSLKSLSVSSLISTLEGIVPPLPVTFGGTMSVEASLTGSAQNLVFSSIVDATPLAVTKAGTFDKKVGVPVTVTTEGSFDGNAVTLKNIAIKPLSSLINIGGRMGLSEKAGSFEVKSDRIDVGELIGVLTKGMSSASSEPITLTASIATAPDGASIPSFKGTLYGGTLDGSLDLRAGKIRSETRLATINVASALAALAPSAPAILTGTLVSLNSSVSAPQGEELMKSIRGGGDLLLKDGSLVGFNLVGSVLQAVSSIPGLAGSLYNQLGASEKGGVDSPNTAIQSAKVSYSLAGDKVELTKLEVESPLFSLSANGTSTFTGEININGEITLSKMLSATLAARSDKVRALLSKDERLVVPLILQGTAPKIVVVPDIEKLLASAAGNLIKDRAAKEAGKLLDKAFGGGSGGSGKGLFGF